MGADCKVAHQCDWYWKKIVSPEAPSGLVWPTTKSRNIPLIQATKLQSLIQRKMIKHGMYTLEDTEHPEISRKQLHE